MTKTKDGEYIALSWDCDHPSEEYVHGHVTPAEFLAVFERERWDATDAPLPKLAEVRHEYGRYVFSGQDEYGNPTRTLKTYTEHGPGRFRVTVVDYPQLYPPVPCGICEHTIKGPREMADGKPNHWQCIVKRKRERENEEYEAQKAAGWIWVGSQWVPPNQPPAPPSCAMASDATPITNAIPKPCVTAANQARDTSANTKEGSP